MKKYLSLMLIAVLVLGLGTFSGCSNSEKIVYANQANFELDTYNARVNDTFNVSVNQFTIEPLNSELSASYTSSNPAIASINAVTGEINCLSEGTVVIYAQVKSSKTTHVGDSFTLVVNEQLIYPTGLSLENNDKVIVALSNMAETNPATLFGEGNINVLPEVSYSSMGIASYDAVTGIITPESIGVVTVYVTARLDENITVTSQFEIEIVQMLIEIVVDDQHLLASNGLQYISFVVKDYSKENNMATYQTVTVEILSGDNLIVVEENDYQYILISSGTESGTAVVKLTYEGDSSVSKTIGIVIN